MHKSKWNASTAVRIVSGFGAIAMVIANLHGDVTPGTQPAIQTVNPVAQESINQLIKQLGNDDAQERDAAQKRLIDIGQSAVELLKKAAEDDNDPEIRSRSAAALALMKELDSTGSSLITIHARDKSVDDVLKDIGRQAHASFIGYGPTLIAGRPNATLSLEADRKPFWEVMADLCSQLNVCPSPDIPGKNAIRLQAAPRNWMAQPTHLIVGPYWVSVAGIYRTRSIDMLGPQQIDDQFTVRLIVYPEPKLRVTQMSEFVVKEAADDAGNSLLPKPQRGMLPGIARGARQINRTVESRLTYPDQPGKTITILRGEVTAMLAQDVKTYEIDDVLGEKKVTNPVTGCKIEVTVARQGTEMFRLNIQCTREGLSDEQWTALTTQLNDLTLTDAEGKELSGFQTATSMTSTNNDVSFTSTSLFNRNVINGAAGNRQMNKTGDPKKLTWNIATSVRPVVIPVTFKDLPMP